MRIFGESNMNLKCVCGAKFGSKHWCPEVGRVVESTSTFVSSYKNNMLMQAIAVVVILAISFLGFLLISGCSLLRDPELIPLIPGTNSVTRAVCIGLNRVDGGCIEYRGWTGQLYGCETDAMRFAKEFTDKGIPTKVLLTEEATIEGVAQALRESGNGLGPSSTVLVTISAHGFDDGLRQRIALYNGTLKDTMVYQWMSLLPRGVRLIWVCDTCHAAGMYRHPSTVSRRVDPVPFDLSSTRGLDCGMILLAGCYVGQSSIDTIDGGAMSKALINLGPGDLGPRQWFDYMSDIIEGNQKPKYVTYGNVPGEYHTLPVIPPSVDLED